MLAAPVAAAAGAARAAPSSCDHEEAPGNGWISLSTTWNHPKNFIAKYIINSFYSTPKDLITFASIRIAPCAANRSAKSVRERLILAAANSKFPRSKSGIPGYDELIGGGFHKGTVNTITGSSGTGKTVFASQFIQYGIKNGERGMIITPSESSEYLKREMMASFGWDFSAMEKSGKLSIVDVTDPILRLQKSIDVDPVEFLINFRKLVERKLDEIKPDRLFIDDLTAFFMAVEAPFKIRSLTDDLFGVIRASGVTALVTIGTAFGTNQFLEYGADSATILGRERIGNNLIRSIYIMKMRGSRIANTIRVLDVSDEGISVSALSPYP
jgi:KaiC/GvpD/RAD55 family RecA-like ATPase